MNIHESELLSLPDHLRKTYLAAISQGECNAIQVSNRTGRCRAIESSYLNQLARTGWLTKRRDMKATYFYPVSKEMAKEESPSDETPAAQPSKLSKESHTGKCRKNEAMPLTMNVKCLSLDYDGTISPINVARRESHVPLEIRVMLGQIGKSLPISIITMKDLHFVTSKTPFANAWSAIGGLETQIGKRVFKNESVESRLPTISQAVDYAKSHAIAFGIEIEEKQDSEGRTLAFCIDWRRARNHDAAKREADNIANYCRVVGLQVFEYANQPFYDVYPIAPDKGKALQEMLNEQSIKSGVMYMGDSETDNSAFKNSSISVGVIHNESHFENLECDYLVKFEDVPKFLKFLITKNYQFSSDFPMIQINPTRRNRTEHQ